MNVRIFWHGRNRNEAKPNAVTSAQRQKEASTEQIVVQVVHTEKEGVKFWFSEVGLCLVISHYSWAWFQKMFFFLGTSITVMRFIG
jgi:hypothetical protein